MGKAKIAGKQPVAVEIEEGKTYAWCACGESSKQPFCDGAHKGIEDITFFVKLLSLSNMD